MPLPVLCKQCQIYIFDHLDSHFDESWILIIVATFMLVLRSENVMLRPVIGLDVNCVSEHFHSHLVKVNVDYMTSQTKKTAFVQKATYFTSTQRTRTTYSDKRKHIFSNVDNLDYIKQLHTN